MLKVTKSDPRYLEEDEALMAGREPRYPHRKPSKATKQRFAVGEVIGSNAITNRLLESPTARIVASTAAVAAAPRLARSAVRSVPKILAAARAVASDPVALGTLIGTVARYSVVTAAGFGSYFATRYIIDHFPTKQRRLDAAADAYRQSRRDLASELGRELTAAELAELSKHYKSIVQDINNAFI